MSTPTLQDLRKQKFKTIKAFSMAYGCSQSKASMILQGRHHMTLSKDEVVKLAALFEVPFESCVKACDASYAEFKTKHNQGKGEFDHLEDHWKYVDDLLKGAEQAKQTGDWRHWHFSFSFRWDDAGGSHSSQDGASGSTRWHTTATPVLSCYTLLGISQNATEAEIKQAFRDKVKASHDGKGGYTIDMDKLVQAKEQALAGLKARV